MLSYVKEFRMFGGTKTEGYDCGDEVSNFVTDFLDVKNKRKLRVLYYVDGLYTERNLSTQKSYWNNPVPKHNEKVRNYSNRKN